MRVLIVEDDATCRIALQAAMTVYAEEVQTVDDGEAALATLSSARSSGSLYDLVCLDIRMPKTDGQTVLYSIRKQEKDAGITRQDRTRVVMTTSLNDSQSVQNAIAAGADGYLLKPVDNNRLEELLLRLKLISQDPLD